MVFVWGSFRLIKLLIMDVDGVLTDAGMYYSANGDELKKFSTYDGMAIEIARQHGVKTAIITSENTKIVEARALKLKIDYVFQGVQDKLAVGVQLCRNNGMSISTDVAFIGDDLNDLSLLKAVRVRGCPANAVAAVKSLSGVKVMSKSGGEGVVREFVEQLIKEEEF